MTTFDDDDLGDFYDDDEVGSDEDSNTWNVLIVDDEEDVHSATKIALSQFEFEGRKLSFTSAYSGRQALDVLYNRNDFALIFVDVVMETEHAGLKLVKAIRKELLNNKCRIILRTGQPGFAPEDEVIREYDINDYRNKADLTAGKIKSSCYTALRSYRDLCNLERSQYGLEEIIVATSKFQEARTQEDFSSHLLEHIAAIVQHEGNDIYCCALVKETDVRKSYHNPQFRVLAVTGSEKTDDITYDELPAPAKTAFEFAMEKQKSVRTDDYFVGFFKTSSGTINLIFVSSPIKLTQIEHNILEYFCNSIAVSYENMNLRLTVQESQREIAYLLGEAVEKRSKETGSHVRRVANYSYLLGRKSGMSKIVAGHLKAASPLHDVGKIAIPDEILNKPGKLTADEWNIMQSHAKQGEDILATSNNEILKMGAIIAGQHHEKWDGSGYPRGLKGEEIHLAGRITALADVFDALSHARCYKPAWDEEKVLELIRENRGSHFDPKLVDLFFENLDEIREIRERFPE